MLLTIEEAIMDEGVKKFLRFEARNTSRFFYSSRHKSRRFEFESKLNKRQLKCYILLIPNCTFTIIENDAFNRSYFL